MFGNEIVMKFLLDEDIYIDEEMLEKEVKEFSPNEVLDYLKDSEGEIFYDQDVTDLVANFKGEKVVEKNYNLPL